MDSKIKSCIHSIFCPTWGEWKCVERKETIKDESVCDTCETFKKIGNDDETPECHCETCEKRVKYELD